MSYWNKKNPYNEPRNHTNTIDIYNRDTGEWETIRLSDFINSYVDNTINSSPEIEATKKQLQSTVNNIKTEIIKAQNIANITDNENKEAEQIWKIKQYLKEKEAEYEAKQKGEK